jgi:hypothetical protein
MPRYNNTKGRAWKAALTFLCVERRSPIVVQREISLPSETVEDRARPVCFLSRRVRTKSIIAMWWPG